MIPTRPDTTSTPHVKGQDWDVIIDECAARMSPIKAEVRRYSKAAKDCGLGRSEVVKDIRDLFVRRGLRLGPRQCIVSHVECGLIYVRLR